MQTPPHIVFHGLSSSPILVARVHEHLEELEQLFDGITGSRVTIEKPHRRQRHGNHYRVKIDLFVPGKLLSTGRDPSGHSNFEDALAAVNEAFLQIRRQLLDYRALKQGFVKTHEPPLRGRVRRILPELDCGFIETEDGREIYFHSHSVLNGDWKVIELGSEVVFAEELGDKGPQASTVRLVRLAHPPAPETTGL